MGGRVGAGPVDAAGEASLSQVSPYRGQRAKPSQMPSPIRDASPLLPAGLTVELRVALGGRKSLQAHSEPPC